MRRETDSASPLLQQRLSQEHHGSVLAELAIFWGFTGSLKANKMQECKQSSAARG